MCSAVRLSRLLEVAEVFGCDLLVIVILLTDEVNCKRVHHRILGSKSWFLVITLEKDDLIIITWCIFSFSLFLLKRCPVIKLIFFLFFSVYCTGLLGSNVLGLLHSSVTHLLFYVSVCSLAPLNHLDSYVACESISNFIFVKT